MFQDMMDRIEDETIKYLYFMRIESGNVPLPYPEPPDDEYDDEEGDNEPGQPGSGNNGSAGQLVAVQAAQREAQQSVLDLTRNIQRKKDRELAELQFTAGDGANQTKTVNKAAKVGRNELCPCGSGKKYKKCHGATG